MKKIVSLFLIIVLCIPGMVAFSETSPFCTLDPETISASSFILVEADTGTIIIEQNAHEQLPMASITKLMGLLIADEYIEADKLKLTDMVSVSRTSADTPGSSAYLIAGTELDLETLLKCIAVQSANDGAVALAEHISGSETEFVKLMNKRASEMGLKNTHYVTASGLDAEDHYSSAADIATLSMEIMVNHPRIMSYAAIDSEVVFNGNNNQQLLSTNKLFAKYDYATGLKTGTTDGAGYCFAATAEKDGTKLVGVVLGAETADARFEDAKKLFEYAYSDFTMATLYKKGNLTDDDGKAVYTSVARGNKSKVALEVREDVRAYIPVKYANKTEVEIKTDKNLKAPVKKGTKVGKINIYAGETLVETLDVVTAEDVKKMNFFQALWQVITAWLSF